MRPLLLGHRGSPRRHRENTLASFAVALEHGCDGFEFDVRRTADGRTVLLHDAALGSRAVAGSTFDELAAQAASLHGGQVALATLDQALAAYGASAFLDIEIKCRDAVEPALEAIEARPPARFVVSSFLPEVVDACRALGPRLPLGWIVDDAALVGRWPELDCAWLMPHHALATASLVEAVHRAGRRIVPWTINDPARMRALAALQVDGIISDRTELLVATLGC